MTPDIILYVRNGENEELRYAIRSWCKNLHFGRLCASGGPFPTWFHPDITHINPTKFAVMQQCYDNLKIALSDNTLSDDVLIMMDDVFITKNLGRWAKNGIRGTLREQYDRMKNKTAYADLLLQTARELESRNLPILSFEEHAPFLCNRHKLLKLFNQLGNDKASSLLWRSLYGNFFKIPYYQRKDIKMLERNTPMSKDIIVSTNERSWAGVAGVVLQEWFSKPSKYER